MTALQMYCSNSPKKTQRRQAGVGCDCLSNCTCAVVTNAVPCHDCVTIYKQTSTWCTWCSPRRSNDSNVLLVSSAFARASTPQSPTRVPENEAAMVTYNTNASYNSISPSLQASVDGQYRSDCTCSLRSDLVCCRQADMILSSISSCKSHHCVQRRHCGIALQYLSYRTCPNIGNLIL